MEPSSTEKLHDSIAVARCHEIQVSLAGKDVPEFDLLTAVGMSVRLALHIRGLPFLEYPLLKMVASHFLSIPSVAVERIVHMLAEVEFVRIQKTGMTIKGILPTVPYYEQLYETLGEYTASSEGFSEPEQFALYLVNRLSQAPEQLDVLRSTSGADAQLFQRGISLGTNGSYLIGRKARGREIVLSPTYFSENAELFADAVAGQGASSVQSLLNALKIHQGYPLALIESTRTIGGVDVSPDQLRLLKRLAQDGIARPPSIETPYSGVNHFLFTPTPSGAALNPTQRDIYERAMAIVAAVRQGQFLPKQYAIRSPGAVLYKLRSELRLGRATTEAAEQYKNLVHLRIGRLKPVGGGFSQFEVIDTEENREALEIAYRLVQGEQPDEGGVDKHARQAMQSDQKYVESLVSAGSMRQRETIELSVDQQTELDLLLLGGEP